jgi:hypothetical protein
MPNFPFVRLVLGVVFVLVRPSPALALDARPFCDARALEKAEKKVLDVPRRIGVDFSIELSKHLPPPVANPADLRELPPVFTERFLLLEKALFGRNGVLKFTGSANHGDGKASMEPGYGVVLDITFAALLEQERPGDSGLIDLVLAHELGHYVQNNYKDVDRTNVLLKVATDMSRFLVTPAVQRKLGKILANRDELSRELRVSAALHAEVNWIGLVLMKKAGAPFRPEAWQQLRRIRDTMFPDSPDAGITREQFLDFNAVEFALTDCAIEAGKAR